MLRRTKTGFTLLEIAIGLLVLGLLVAGIMRGQELLTAARVRQVVQQQDSVRTAFYGFQDRFQSLPGDYNRASSTIADVSQACGVAGSPGNGDGNGYVQGTNGEYLLVWDHLSKAGFLTGRYTCESNTTVNANTAPRNRYGQFIQLVYDDAYAGVVRDRHNLKTGNDIPSDILGEADRKVDDGNALRGAFRGSTYTTGAPTDIACWDADGLWNALTPVANCGGATLF
jgi:type II secretory pathway pseudopilin PulG